MSRPLLFQALEPVVGAFELLSVPYHLGGSVASSAVGTARTTLDVDLVADLRAGQVCPFVAELKDLYYASEAAIRDAVSRRSCFNVIHLPTMFKVDVFVLKERSYDRAAFSRRRLGRLSIGEHSAEFMLASPEDIVLNKLEWFRLGDEVSERQWLDVLGVLRVQRGRLDEKYLVEWANELNLKELLLRAEREAWGTDTQPPARSP